MNEKELTIFDSFSSKFGSLVTPFWPLGIWALPNSTYFYHPPHACVETWVGKRAGPAYPCRVIQPDPGTTIESYRFVAVVSDLRFLTLVLFVLAFAYPRGASGGISQ